MTETNGLASAEQLMAATKGKRRFDRLRLPIAGLRCRIRSLMDRELSAYQSATIASGGTGLKRSRLDDAARRLIVLCLVDNEGNRLFSDSNEHVEQFEEWDAADTSYLYDKCATHCGINRQDIEDLVKNSEEIPAGSALSDSPSE